MSENEPKKDGKAIISWAIGIVTAFSIIEAVLIKCGTFVRAERGSKFGPSDDEANLALGIFVGAVLLPVLIRAISYAMRRSNKLHDRPTKAKAWLCMLAIIGWSLASLLWIGYAVCWRNYDPARLRPLVTVKSSQEEKQVIVDELTGVKPPLHIPVNPVGLKSLPVIVTYCCSSLGFVLAFALCLDIYSVSATEFRKKRTPKAGQPPPEQ